MPRAFLITHRRYNGTEEFEAPGRDYSPERGVRVAEYGGGQPTSDGVSDCGSETSSECPEELYNLTKLAEVSLAAAAGTLIHPSKVLSYQRPLSPGWGHQVVDKYSGQHTITENTSRQNLQTLNSHRIDDLDQNEEGELSLRERTRLFFERIESEREILEGRNVTNTPELLEVRLSRAPSPSRSHLEDDGSRLSNSAESTFIAESRIEPSSKNVATLSRKSSSIASSEGSKSDDSEDHECPDCGKKYSTSSNLARHRQTHRSLGDKKARRCPHCDKIYVSMPAFSMHVRTHNQGCKCHYCGKCFSRPWLLQGHIRTHTGEKPFKCTICNKAFADKSNLRAHVQTHSNTKPHVCGRCGKAFALKSYLYKHEESSCMRAHNRAISEKQEGSSESNGALSALPSTNSTVTRVLTSPITASPTSVIVPRPGLPRESRTLSPTAFSTIIRHTKNQVVSSETSLSPPKRQCRDKNSVVSEERPKDPESGIKTAEYLSRMVIRTSVISPNPEQLVRLGGSLNRKKSTAFDFSDPSRASAFSRPTAITLNLAIA